MINDFYKKYIIAVTGYAGDGKTTTITKLYDKLASTGKISAVRHIWGVPDINNPTYDFSLIGNSRYGATGFVSRGEQIYALRDDLEYLAKEDCQVIVCACRKECPDTYKAVAEISWRYGYYIDWADFSVPPGMSKDDYTEQLSLDLYLLF